MAWHRSEFGGGLQQKAVGTSTRLNYPTAPRCFFQSKPWTGTAKLNVRSRRSLCTDALKQVILLLLLLLLLQLWSAFRSRIPHDGYLLAPSLALRSHFQTTDICYILARDSGLVRSWCERSRCRQWISHPLQTGSLADSSDLSFLAWRGWILGSRRMLNV